MAQENRVIIRATPTITPNMENRVRINKERV